MSGFSSIIAAVLLLSLCLWISLLVTKIRPSVATVLNISIATVLVSFIPVVGVPLAMAALLLLISKLTGTRLWPKPVVATVITFVLLRVLVLLVRYAYEASQTPAL